MTPSRKPSTDLRPYCTACEEHFEGEHCPYCWDGPEWDDDAIDIFGFPVNSIASRRASDAFDERNLA